MPAREDIVNDFWMRFTEGRGALGGEVRFYDFAEEQLDDWKTRVRDEVAGFLRDYEPNFQDFAARALSPRARASDDTWMIAVLRAQVSAAFFEWLERRGIPRDVALRARGVYEFHFGIRDRDRG